MNDRNRLTVATKIRRPDGTYVMLKDFDENLTAFDYIEKKQLEIIKRIEEMAEHGSKEDLVRLKANQILLNKILPDKTRHEVGLDNTSPMTILLAAIQVNAQAEKRLKEGDKFPALPEITEGNDDAKSS
jgi:hypothetical protein